MEDLMYVLIFLLVANNSQNLREEKGKGGLADIETSSVNFLSEMLEFDLDFEEADEIAEEDLIYLQDESTKLDIVVNIVY